MRTASTKLTAMTGFLVIGVLSTGTGTSAWFYRDARGRLFSIQDHFLSQLGEVGLSRWAAAFNLGLLVGGLILAIFLMRLGRHLGNHWGHAAAGVGVLSGVFCALIGVVPMNDLEIHSLIACAYFNHMLAAITFVSLGILRDRQGKLTRWLLVPAGVVMVGCAWFAVLPQPAPELVVCVSMFVWIGLTAASLVLHRPGRSSARLPLRSYRCGLPSARLISNF